MTKLRISAHTLEIERGRYKKIPFENRLCNYCKTEIEDEKHFILYCKNYENRRKLLFQNLSEIFPHFINMDNERKFIFLLSMQEYI